MTTLPAPWHDSAFPDPDDAPADAPFAAGGDFDGALLLDAYGNGIFPWPLADGTPLWWSPDPRAVIPLDGLRISRSLERTLRRSTWRVSVDEAFEAVVAGCADRAGEGTWIVPALMTGYAELHAAGWAHSVEVWDDDVLVGGLYGIAVGAAFCGESMFHRRTDASKIALVHLVDRLRAGGFALLDAQLPTPHLASLGAVAVPRVAFLAELRRVRELPASLR